jgi:hypothetical protein
MKTISSTLKITTLAAVTVSLLFLNSCKKDDPAIAETDRVAGLLKASTWKMQSVMVDGTDRTTIYTGLILNFTANGYTTTNGGAVWPASGTWLFADVTAKLITRSDGLALTVEEITTTKLSLKLTWSKSTLGGGRTSSLAGVHVFVFGK